ncbi:MAG: nucleoside triphosphate pyrophosphohydrolase [Candidatus Eremiobacteraeota bacterium]|nr:nucleoside triphosphate pyrophosphohydrolase [Candidatus Eremiobacteraeota bacterium]
MLVRVVGLGPGDPALLTVGSLDALRSIGRAILLLAPPELVKYINARGVDILRTSSEDAGLVVRGSREHVERFVDELSEADVAIGVIGNPLSDFAGLPIMLRTLERRGAKTEIIPGMPRATLSAALNMPLVPLPPGSAHHTWDELVEIMARLRLSCPWDREQTHRTLMPYLIEEAYEVIEAIEHNNEAGLCEELGDLLLQIVFHSQLATETGRFSVADVIDALSNKMIRRHPHVFGDAVIEDVDAQWKNWEQLKAQEATGKARASRLDGIPRALGALQRGQRMQEKAARIGFDWPGPKEVLDKLGEELGELAQARRERQDDPRVREELGDVFFTLVNLTRALGVDAETAMREANEKFYRRFSFMEKHAMTHGRDLSEMSLDELEELWQLAKTEAA